MKRSTFKRPVYEPAPAAPLRPLLVPPNYSALHRVVAVPKETVFRSESYRRFVAGFGCFACGIEKWSQCAHSNQARHGTAGRNDGLSPHA
jgi:hypothetical protein